MVIIGVFCYKNVMMMIYKSVIMMIHKSDDDDLQEYGLKVDMMIINEEVMNLMMYTIIVSTEDISAADLVQSTV